MILPRHFARARAGAPVGTRLSKRSFLFRHRGAVLTVSLLTLPQISRAQAQQTGPQKAVRLIGLAGVKDHSKSTLRGENGKRYFAHAKTGVDISALSIRDVLTGTDSKKSVGAAVGLLSMAAPYGGGRFTVAGATAITVHCRFTKPDGTGLLQQDVHGNVRFFAGNLKATYDFAKKTAHIVRENFSPA
jgi:hypothetical protein